MATKPMIRTIAWILFFSASCNVKLYSQELTYKVTWGKEFNASRRSTLSDIVAHDGSGIYAIKKRQGFASTDLTLEHYNKAFLPTASFDMELGTGRDKSEVNNLFFLKGKLYIFYSLVERKGKKETLLIRELDKVTLQPKGEQKQIAEIDLTEEYKYRGTLNYAISRDSAQVLIAYTYATEEEKPFQLTYYVLDNDWSLRWKKDITLPYQTELFDAQTFKVDNDGNAYLLGKVFNEKRKEKRRGRPNFNYEVVACRDQGKAVKQYPITLPDRFLTDMQMEVQDAKTILCAGFYSATGTVSIRGTYFLKVNAETQTIIAKNFKEFDSDFIKQYMNSREAKKVDRKEKKGQEQELYEYNLDKIVVGKDGSAIVIAEQFFEKTTTSYQRINGMTNQITTTHYFFNDIIVVKINAMGEILWAQKIPKKQHTVDDNGFYSSYTMAIVRGKFCFIFNDNPDNLDLDENEGAANYKPSKSIVVLAYLDQNGNLTKKPILNASDLDVITVPKVCEQIANNEVILFGQRKKTQQFGKLVFD
jgi:hypothetical protein